MPYMKVDTNVALSAEKADLLLRECSAILARVTGKPESACQTTVCGGLAMLFAGSGEPTAHVEVKGINFQAGATAPMAKEMCGLLERELGIPGRRVYLACVNYQASMWGVNGAAVGS